MADISDAVLKHLLSRIPDVHREHYEAIAAIKMPIDNRTALDEALTQVGVEHSQRLTALFAANDFPMSSTDNALDKLTERLAPLQPDPLASDAGGPVAMRIGRGLPPILQELAVAAQLYQNIWDNSQCMNRAAIRLNACLAWAGDDPDRKLECADLYDQELSGCSRGPWF